MEDKYKQMIYKMYEDELATAKKKKAAEDWYVYILECGDRTYYTGIAKDLANRIRMHRLGKAAKYTKARLPVYLLYHETCRSRSEALVRECEIKALSKKQKLKLIMSGILD